MNDIIQIYDTTLRDGAQTVGISYSLQDKITITMALDRLKIDYIEGGWPGANPKDSNYFQTIKDIPLSHSQIVAFGSTARKKIRVQHDEQIQAIINSGVKTACIVAKTWDFHVVRALDMKLEENLILIYNSIAYLKDMGLKVFLDAEHYFNGYLSNPDYALASLEKAIQAGVDMIILCDTNGGTLPDEAARILQATHCSIQIPIGVHFHNDSGVAVANSIVAINAGAVLVQGTVNGYGERCGNCDLMTMIPNIVIKMKRACNAADSLMHLTEISRLVSETSNFGHNDRAPYVGDNAFTHKGGIHVSALQKDTNTYEHIDPLTVGNKRKVSISELAGKSNVQFKAKEMGIDFSDDVSLPKKMLKKIKDLEEQGFQFEAAEGSFELLIRQATGDYKPFFILHGFRVISEMNHKEKLMCEATIKVEVDGTIEHTAANGYGPVEALDNALRKALENFYPEIRNLHLSDYKVRVLNEKEGTGAPVRVLIDHRLNTHHWGTVGVSQDIIEASWQAIVDGIEYMLYKNINNL